ncbi:MAG: ABC transporter permease [Bryobacteraceae bacterium]|jgi:putative ABC transport system permease protein
MIRRLFLKLFRRRRLQQDLEAEIAFHREMSAAGGNPIPFGNAGLIREQAFDVWRFHGIENLWRDLVYAIRGLRKSPGFVLTALLSLGLGIGVNTAMFSLAVEFLLSQPSVRDASSLVYVRHGGNSHMLPATIEALRHSGVFQDVAGENEETFINFNNGSETRRIFAVQATRNYFTALGVPVQQGRGWNETDANEVAVLHPHFWRTRLGGDPAIVGKTIRLDGRLYTVLGILPDSYRSLIGYGFSPDIFVPQYIEGTILAAYARVKPGMGLGQLNAAMPAVGERLDREFPSQHGLNKQIRATPVSGFARLEKEREALTVSLFFAILLAIVGLVLLIACVNVAGLLLARASVRRQEIAIRLALGASRGRLLQQLLAESLLLSLAGAALGFLFALGVAKAAAAIPLPIPVPIRLQIEPDWRVASYAALMAIFSAIACGLMPAWQSLKESLSAGMHRERKLRIRRALVIAQIAVSFIVLTTAALFLQNLVRASSLGPGFDTRQTLRAEVYLPPNVYKDGRTINPYVSRALDGLRAIPGVEYAAAARIIPFTDSTQFGSELTFPDTGEKQHSQFNWNAVTPDYFHVMDIPLLRGRPFVAQDNGGSRVAIVNEEFVRRYLGMRDPIGATFLWTEDKTPYRIVGVARGTKNMTIGEDPRPQLYEPLAQIKNDRPRIQFVTRSVTPPAAQLAAVQQALRQAEPAAGLEVETMFSAIGFAFLPSQVGAALMGSIGVLGLLLAIIGLYGVLAYSVARRTREIGIRMAIGASPNNVSGMVLREFARLLITGIGIGLGIALLVTRPLSMFFVPGLSASDPASFAAVIAVLGLTGVMAVIAPLRRALGVDPLQCLRYE